MLLSRESLQRGAVGVPLGRRGLQPGSQPAFEGALLPVEDVRAAQQCRARPGVPRDAFERAVFGNRVAAEGAEGNWQISRRLRLSARAAPREREAASGLMAPARS